MHSTVTQSNLMILLFSFFTKFDFVIVPQVKNLGGHGFAFTISASTDSSKAIANQYLGLFNFTNNDPLSNHVFAVEFDTIQNPEFEDINDNHVGLNINGLKSIDSIPISYFSNIEGKNRT